RRGDGVVVLAAGLQDALHLEASLQPAQRVQRRRVDALGAEAAAEDEQRRAGAVELELAPRLLAFAGEDVAAHGIARNLQVIALREVAPRFEERQVHLAR